MKIISSSVFFLLAVSSFFLFSCSEESESVLPNPITTESPNILLIIADDLGKDAISGFSEGIVKPSTPHIDALRQNGLTFSNFWVHPTCTPTRSAILTGKYGYRTNVKGAGDVLSASEKSLQEYISENTNNTYASAIVGKWHLSGNNTSINPESFGIDYYTGLIRGAVDDYYRWQLYEDGSTNLETEYITTYFTDVSIDWMNQQTKPWFLWLAYNAPHTPFHSPPTEMHNQGNLPAYTSGLEPLPYYLAAIEAMDYQIGRLLDSMSDEERENTLIIFIGDNGTPNQAAQSPYSSNKVKNTLFQGGINVPMFVSGVGVSRRGEDDNLITATDLFATIAEASGVGINEINDSKSFASLFGASSEIRAFQYSEMDNGTTTNAWAISNGTYKLIINSLGEEQMYNLSTDPLRKQ